MILEELKTGKKVRCVCESCEGTGIYKGVAEHDDLGVICHYCNGTGNYVLNVEDNMQLVRDNNNESVFSKTVTFYLRNQISCFNCGYPSCRRMAFNTFDLDIYGTYQSCQNNINIYDCLDYWQSRNYPNLYCYNCKDFTPRNKISIIESSPKVFIFLLQRGINFDQYNKETNINFIIDEQIDLSKYIEEKSSNLYELTGIVSILASKKKYISYCKSPIDQAWYVYDDEMVNCISLSDIINDSLNQKTIPCILYYIKNGN